MNERKAKNDKYSTSLIEVYEAREHEKQKVIIFRWAAKNIGFGELVLNSETLEIIDDECMTKAFTDIIKRKGFALLKKERNEKNE